MLVLKCGLFEESGKALGNGCGRGLASGNNGVPAMGTRVDICVCGAIIIFSSVEKSCPGALFCTEGLLPVIFDSVGGLDVGGVGFALGMFVRE